MVTEQTCGERVCVSYVRETQTMTEGGEGGGRERERERGREGEGEGGMVFSPLRLGHQGKNQRLRRRGEKVQCLASTTTQGGADPPAQSSHPQTLPSSGSAEWQADHACLNRQPPTESEHACLPTQRGDAWLTRTLPHNRSCLPEQANSTGSNPICLVRLPPKGLR
jgi:hypothetical protein